ncbi:hypothetical protein RSAG8_03149, partial [Rhizoctonia solani AG-8 WAC10335]
MQLAKSWEESPEITLRIIWNMRSIHEGHNNKIGFYQAFGWLYKYHPRTAIENIRFVTERLCERQVERQVRGTNSDSEEDDFELVESDGEIVEEAAKMSHGYYKDLLNIMVLAMRGKLTDPALVGADSLKVHPIRRNTRTMEEWEGIKATKKKQNEELGVDEAKKRRKIGSRQIVEAQAKEAKEKRKRQYNADHALLKEKLENDKLFLALYVTVAHIFADELANDIALMKKIETASEEEGFDLKFEISSAAKWAPSLDGAHDRSTNIATAIALVMSTLVDADSLKIQPIRRSTRTVKEWKGIKAIKKKQNEEFGVDDAKKQREIGSRRTVEAQAQEAKEKRKRQYNADRTLLKEKFENDKLFLALYVTIAHIFADELANDIALMKKIETASEEEGFDLKFEISSAAKWAPSLDGAHDRSTNIATAIALVMYSKGNLAELSLSIASEITQEQAQVLRSYYRRWVISPLRRFIDVTEVKMSSQKWNRINYKHVPAECMKKYKNSFFKHDEKRLAKYLADVAVGKSSISGATLLPHELLIEALKVEVASPVPGGLAGQRAVQREIQRRFEEGRGSWNSLLGRLNESGALENSLGLVDVSGSMGSFDLLPQTTRGPIPPIFPAVALGLALAALAKPPFNNMFVTFSSTPELLTVPPGGIADQAKWMVRTNWEMNTDYEAVFLKLILPAAVQNKVKPEDMVKRLFVFSDMQFDQSVQKRHTGDEDAWQTTHDRVVNAFEEAGYEAPEIVYWNLQRRTTKTVLKDTPGTALLTGFSANMMKLFMAGESVEDDFVEIDSNGGGFRMRRNDPLTLMERALSKSCYAPLRVFD